VRPIAFEKAADGSTSRMFVQLSGLNGFAVVDFKTHKEVSRVQLPPDPHDGHAESGAPAHGLTVSPDNKSLWVNSSVASAVFVYSLPDLKVLGYVKVGEVPDWLTFTPDGKLVYVANAGSNSVSVIDAATRKEVVRIPVGEVRGTASPDQPGASRLRPAPFARVTHSARSSSGIVLRAKLPATAMELIAARRNHQRMNQQRLAAHVSTTQFFALSKFC
jgi:YVTN family beta-propeller protein